MSPGFTPRPSLSGVFQGHVRRFRHVSPGFTPRPSLSEGFRGAFRGGQGCVAGVHTSAFVERSRSVDRYGAVRSSVAGVHTSAFVERASAGGRSATRSSVSPGFTPRPSLSVPTHHRVGTTREVSPGFTPRPSLSVGTLDDHLPDAPRVAGVHTSAFVERARYPTSPVAT